MHLSRQYNCRSLRCSWSIACRRCSKYIFILDLTPGFIGLGKDNCKTRWGTIKFGGLVRLILEILRYLLLASSNTYCHLLVTPHLTSTHWGWLKSLAICRADSRVALANGRRRYFVTTSVIGWAETYIPLCIFRHLFPMRILKIILYFD